MWHHRLFAISSVFAVVLGSIAGDFFPNTLTGHLKNESAVALPVAACTPFQTITLNANGEKTLFSVQLDDGSFDPGGGFIWFKARRIDYGSSCASDSLFRSQINFCCADAGDTIEILLRVYNVPVDTGGVSAQYALANASDCIAKVFVSELVKPVIATLPSDTISCSFFLSNIYFPPEASDDCCLDTIIKTDQFITYDTACKRGLVRRRFTAVDCVGNTAFSTQNITVVNEQFYVVQFPADVIITGCSNLSANILGKPVIFEGNCEKMNLTYIDTLEYTSGASGLPCLTVRRSWRVFNWCNYSANIPLTTIPNPAPEPYSLSPENLPGPVVGPQGVASVVKILPSDPQPTDFSSFWQQNVNGFSYTQIIRVYDNQPPQARISSGSSFCDLTINDPTLWEGISWNGDKEEGPALLALRGTDNCTYNDIAIYYELFLDLDNDKTQETLVSSQTPPPPGSVDFGNLLPGGGDQRQFDRRIAGINQKYNFALERIITGDSMTARVKWNTLANPNNYTTPQFPYGHHKLVWHLTDKCGNETIVTHIFTISNDCEPPVITCVPDLTVEIPATGDSVFVSTNGLVYNVQDNATPSNEIEITIEKHPYSAHFPPNSPPVYGLFFNCSELGFQPVRIWARDAFGNESHCETIVVVNDPEQYCAQFAPAISGRAFTLAEEPMPLHLDLFEMPDSVFVATSSTLPLGFYYFNDLALLGNYTIIPRVDSSDLLNGVNTYDLILISRHILNLEPLNSPYKLIAADINKSGTITTFDIVTARKAILGTILEFPGNTSWRSIPKNFQFSDPSNPFASAFPERLNLSSIYQVISDADFYCVKVGDVDWSAAAPHQVTTTEDRQREAGLMLELGDPKFDEGRVVAPLYARATTPLAGFQLDVALNGALNFESKTIPKDHYVFNGQVLRMSWEYAIPDTTKPILLGDWVLSGHHRNQIPDLNIMTAASMAWSDSGQKLAIGNRRHSIITADNPVSLTPNPFSENLVLNMAAHLDTEIIIRITDSQGRPLWHQKVNGATNDYSLPINTASWPSGIYICRVETSDTAFFTKIVVKN